MLSPAAMLAKILRLPFSLIPPEAEVRILSGPTRGKKWIKGAGPNSYWVGTYESARIRGLASATTQGAVVYDVGANVGIYSLLASVRVGPSGSVYAFEPLERNLRYLRRHIALNNLQNCLVVESAVSNSPYRLTLSKVMFSTSCRVVSPWSLTAPPSTGALVR